MADMINNPDHYAKHAVTVVYQPIDLCETCGFLLGNAFKYLFRYEDKGKPVEDLQKALYYLNRYRDSVIKYVNFSSDLEKDLCEPDSYMLHVFKDTWFIQDWFKGKQKNDRTKIVDFIIRSTENRLAALINK